MPAYNFDPGQQYTFDSWGWSPRNDWEKFSHQGRDAWRIRGETNDPNEAFADPSNLYATADQAWDTYGRTRPTPSPGVNQSENAYYASLDRMGIGRDELPYGRYGQEMTARVFQRHGLPLPDYLKPYGNPEDWHVPPTGGGYTDAVGNQWSSGWMDPNFNPIEQNLDERRPQASVQPGLYSNAVTPDIFLNTINNNTKMRLDADKIRKIRTTLRRSLLDYLGG